MGKTIHTDAVDQLFSAILSLKTKDECYAFFEDVCTINEILSLAQRFEVAKMLKEGFTYLEISEKTGASGFFLSVPNLRASHNSVPSPGLRINRPALQSFEARRYPGNPCVFRTSGGSTPRRP